MFRIFLFIVLLVISFYLLWENYKMNYLIGFIIILVSIVCIIYCFFSLIRIDNLLIFLENKDYFEELRLKKIIELRIDESIPESDIGVNLKEKMFKVGMMKWRKRSNYSKWKFFIKWYLFEDTFQYTTIYYEQNDNIYEKR